MTDPAISGYAKTAAEVYEQDGRDGLAAYLDRIQGESNIGILTQ